jgi:hypothetical protein
MKHLRTFTISMALLFGAVAASPASATNITIKDVETGNGDLGNVSVPGYGNPWTTPILMTDTSGKTYVVFCDDLNHLVYVGGNQSLPYHTGYVTEDGLGNPISKIISNEMGQLADIGREAYHKGDENGAIAAQAAIWGLEYGVKVTSTDSSLDDLIQTDMSIGYHGGGYALGLIANTGFFQQAQIIGSAAPEPGAWALMMFGVGALGIALRRSRRRQALATA